MLSIPFKLLVQVRKVFSDILFIRCSQYLTVSWAYSAVPPPLGNCQTLPNHYWHLATCAAKENGQVQPQRHFSCLDHCNRR